MKRSTRIAITLPLAALALAVSSAYAAPTVGPTDASFFTQPLPMPSGNHGDLIQYRKTTVNLGKGAPLANAWNVLYHSTDGVDTPIAVSGTVLVPTTAWSGSGQRPTILYAVGTHGLAQVCAPSRQLAKGTDYEIANINAALKAGYAVLVTDYQGYVTNSAPTYIVGSSQGHAVLDIFKAALSIPSVGITASSPVGIWGYSQGGQSAAWAGELLSTYAPAIKAVGVAAGGVPADLVRISPYLDSSAGFAFLGMALAGLSNQYEELPVDIILTDSGSAELAKLNNDDQCIFQSLFNFQNNSTANYTIGGKDINNLISQPLVRKVIDKQLLGTKKVPVPMYMFHGQADEFISLDQDLALKKSYCDKGTPVAFDLYPSEHIVTQFQSAAPVMTWMADRFAGKTAPTTCSNTTVPPSTANPPGGDLVVSLNKWKLDAKVHLKLLNSDVQLPAATTMTADANINAKTLKGSLTVPKFTQKVNVIGLKVPVSLTIESAGDISGSTSLDEAGGLHIDGIAPVNIIITSLAYIPFGQCKTITPVNFPIKFDGPLSSLANGQLAFGGTVAFPKLTGCGISGTLSALMSGNGQTYNFVVTPPAPTKN
jgi:hypothetical protein